MVKDLNSEETKEILALLLESQVKLDKKPIGRDLTKPWFVNCEPKDIGF